MKSSISPPSPSEAPGSPGAADLADDVLEALQTLALAGDAETTRRVIQAQPALLRPSLDDLLTRLIQEAWASGSLVTAGFFAASRAWLARCRVAGVEAALREPPAWPLERGGALGELRRLTYAPADLTQRAAAARRALADLRVATEPDLWATLQVDLADSLMHLAEPHPITRLEEAVAGYEAALEAWEARAPQASAEQVAHARQAHFVAVRILAAHYCACADAGRAQAIEAAIARLEQALGSPLASPETQPLAWGRAQIVLGNAYLARLHGSRKENLQRAEKCQQAAVNVLADAANAEDRARALYNLAIVYRHTLVRERAQNLRQSLVYFEQASAVFTRAAYPKEWAFLQTARGDVYGQREFGDRPASLRTAIECYRAALQVRTRASDPAGWATLQNNLGNVYAEWAEDEPDRAGLAQLMRQAITHYEAALAERPRARSPAEWAETANNLGVVYSERPTHNAEADFDRAVHYLNQALQVHTPRLYPYACRRAALNLARLLFFRRSWEAAQQAYATAGEAMEALYSAALTEPGRQSELAQAHDVFIHQAYALARLGRLDEAAACLEAGRARAVGQALARNTASFTAASDDDQRAFAAARDHLAALEAEARWTDELINADVRPPRPARDSVTIMQDLTQANIEFEAVVARLRAKMPDFMPEAWRPASLQATAQAVGQPIIYLATTPLGGLALIVPAEAPVEVIWLDALTTLNEAFDLPSDLARLWPALYDICLQPLLAGLQRLGHARAVLIPCGRLSLLPLPAIAAEAVTFSYAPSARSLRAVSADLPRRRDHPAQLMGVGAPANDLPELSFARFEVETIRALFPAAPQRVLVDDAATQAAVRAALPGATHLHFACHGDFYERQPLESAVHLAGADRLTLKMILENAADLSAARLVVLSACQTGLIEARQVPDEMVGFPAGFLQAGVPGVVSTLWPVNDLSTALLMIKFYDGHLGAGLAPAEALRRAQLWLRDVTYAELGEWFELYQPAADDPAPAAHTLKAQAELAYYLSHPDQQKRPFSSPAYWAPFIFYGV